MNQPRRRTLKQRVLGAGGWSIAGHGLGQVIRLVSNLIMTRLLVPEMFGIMAIATMVTMILGMLSDIGLRQNIVQSRRGEDRDFLDTAWVVQILRGFALWFAATILSVSIYFGKLAGLLPDASVYSSSILPQVIVASAFSAVILGFQSTKMATADRRFDQKRLVQIEIVSQLTGLAVMLAIGLITHSIWALVAGGLAGSLITTLLSHAWINGSSNRFRWEKAALVELMGFGKWIFISSSMTVLATTGDRLLLGGLISAEMLGLYAIAALIARSVENALHKLFQSVSLPAYSEIYRESPDRLREVYYKLRVPADIVLLVLAGFLFTTGQTIIDLLYDPRYSRAGGMLQVLSLSLFATRFGFAHQIYLAVGITRYLAIINGVRFIALYASVPVLYYLAGIEGAIWGIALHAIATVPFIYYFNAKLGVNDFRREILVLPALALGYYFGIEVNLLIH
jgi:O-antigen/teichoic acid export membrane protein